MLGKTDHSAGASAPAPAQRPATELLYDSEASLRLIDAVLDDMNARPAGSARRQPDAMRQPLQLGALTDADDEHGPSLRAYWEVQELLEAVQQGRSRMGRALTGADLIGAPYDDDTTVPHDVDSGLYRALLLVDRLDPSEGTVDADREALCAQLRSEILNVMGHLRRGSDVIGHLEAAAGLLYSVETRLTQVSAALDPGAPSWGAQD